MIQNPHKTHAEEIRKKLETETNPELAVIHQEYLEKAIVRATAFDEQVAKLERLQAVEREERARVLKALEQERTVTTHRTEPEKVRRGGVVTQAFEDEKNSTVKKRYFYPGVVSAAMGIEEPVEIPQRQTKKGHIANLVEEPHRPVRGQGVVSQAVNRDRERKN